MYFFQTKSEFLLLEMCISVATKVFQFLTVYDFNSRYLFIKDVSLSLWVIQDKYIFLNS